MKKSLALMILFSVLMSGAVVQAGGMPSVVGVWKGLLNYANSSEGYGTVKSKLVVTDQSGGLFRGFFVNEGQPETHWVAGSIRTSLVLSGGYDIAASMTADGSMAIFFSALLVTTSTPWKMTRVQIIGFNGDTAGIHANLAAQGTLTKK